MCVTGLVCERRRERLVLRDGVRRECNVDKVQKATNQTTLKRRLKRPINNRKCRRMKEKEAKKEPQMVELEASGGQNPKFNASHQTKNDWNHDARGIQCRLLT